MEAACPVDIWTAISFLETDQSCFGDDWRYELVDGSIVAHTAPSPDHGAIFASLATALGARLAGHPAGCRPEIGSGAAPKNQQRATARIPDATLRCGGDSRVVFEVVSPSELRACKQPNASWVMEALGGLDATLRLESIDLSIPLSEIYAFVGLSAP